MSTQKKVMIVAGNRDYISMVRCVTNDIVPYSIDFEQAPENYGLIMFTGGADVDPSLYGDTSPNGLCGSGISRDLVERRIFIKAVKCGIPMVGICRGIQFLNVMCGGKMMHHLDGHAGGVHFVKTLTDECIRVNSFHHQMILPNKDAIVTEWSHTRLSFSYFGYGDKIVSYTGEEIEGAIFPKQKAFGVQYHPEMMLYEQPAVHRFVRMLRNVLEMPWENFVKKYSGGKYDGVAKESIVDSTITK